MDSFAKGIVCCIVKPVSQEGLARAMAELERLSACRIICCPYDTIEVTKMIRRISFPDRFSKIHVQSKKFR